MEHNNFIKKLNYYLRFLKKKDRQIELEKYKNLNHNNLDPAIEANKIYEQHGLSIRITDNIKFLDAASSILKALKDKNKMGDILFFLIKLLLLIIIIKIPFIYVRDMIVTLLNDTFTNETNYMIWTLIIEFAYAFISIIIIMRQFKKKTYELNKQENL